MKTAAGEQQTSAAAEIAAELEQVRAQLKVSAKTERATKIDLTCLEKEMNAKTKVDGAKNQLISMQEKKIGQQQAEVTSRLCKSCQNMRRIT